MKDSDRTLLVDASVWITLSETNSIDFLRELDGRVVIPASVFEEIKTNPAMADLESASGDWVLSEPILKNRTVFDEIDEHVEMAASQLGAEDESEFTGDVGLLSMALRNDRPVVVTDDKPLRQTCKALSIPVSGSIGVLIRAVERGECTAEDAKQKLYAMDEVGARLSASLVRKAERLIDDASD